MHRLQPVSNDDGWRSRQHHFIDVPLPVFETGTLCPALFGFADHLYTVTVDEIKVADDVRPNASMAAIAERLVISENTVRSHSKHIYAKLDVHSKQEILDLIAQG